MLLERLAIDFEVYSPQVDESRHQSESADNLVSRLAHDKARAVAVQFPSAVVIGSDQLLAAEAAVAASRLCLRCVRLRYLKSFWKK